MAQLPDSTQRAKDIPKNSKVKQSGQQVVASHDRTTGGLGKWPDERQRKFARTLDDGN
jgi:hypothetical protein